MGDVGRCGSLGGSLCVCENVGLLGLKGDELPMRCADEEIFGYMTCTKGMFNRYVQRRGGSC